jgi:hypothetical protein
MASNQDYEVPIAGKWKDLMVLEDGEEVVPEPTGAEAETKVWNAQLMIPFPLHVTFGPKVFESDPYNFGYLKNSLKLFRTARYTAHKDYIPWLDRVEKDFKDTWKSYGIYPLTQ